MNIKKAVIAAAGWSTRFLPAVKSYAKHLVPIGSKPQIQYSVEELVAAGIDQICIVHRHGELTIKRHFTPDPILSDYLKKNHKEQYLADLEHIWQNVKVLKFIPQARHLPYGNGSPILAAKNFIGSDPFVFMYGDDFVLEHKPGQTINSLIQTFSQYRPQAILACQEIPHADVSSYGIVKFKENPTVPNQLDAVIEKPSQHDAPSNITVFGRFVLTSKIVSVLQATNLAKGELWLSDALNQLAKSDIVIGQTLKNAKWLTTGDPLNFLLANIEVALSDPKISPSLQKFLKSISR